MIGWFNSEQNEHHLADYLAYSQMYLLDRTYDILIKFRSKVCLWGPSWQQVTIVQLMIHSNASLTEAKKYGTG